MFSEKKKFSLGSNAIVDIFGSSLGYLVRSFFLSVKVQIGIILGVAKFQTFLGVCLKFLIFLGGTSR